MKQDHNNNHYNPESQMFKLEQIGSTNIMTTDVECNGKESSKRNLNFKAKSESKKIMQNNARVLEQQGL